MYRFYAEWDEHAEDGGTEMVSNASNDAEAIGHAAEHVRAFPNNVVHIRKDGVYLAEVRATLDGQRLLLEWHRGAEVCELTLPPYAALVGQWFANLISHDDDARQHAPELLAALKFAYAHCDPTPGREEEWRCIPSAIAKVEDR
jgi:hypothetical protein